MNSYAIKFRRVLGLGILINIPMVLSIFIAPEAVLGLLKIPVDDPVWPRSVIFLLGLITVAYVAGLDPMRNRMAAAYTVLVRTSGVVVFGALVAFGAPKGFLGFVAYDLIFGALQGFFLYKAFQEG